MAAATWLEIDHQWIPVDILAGETHTEEFEKMNSNTRIPVLVLGNYNSMQRWITAIESPPKYTGMND